MTKQAYPPSITGTEGILHPGSVVDHKFGAGDPYTLGVGPAGDYVARLDPPAREALEARCRERLPDGPFEIHASAWAARAHVP